MKNYMTCPKVRCIIDDLLKKNAEYQASSSCITNTKEKKKEINRYCNREFIHPIMQIDPVFYKSISVQND
tara:strand:+ start:776 stop:985 length:210 start_codon:yes stop_codon:yes gene_type:complete